jgi:hypothetical protein
MSIWVKKKCLNALYMIVSLYNQVYPYSINRWRSCYVCDKKFLFGFLNNNKKK